MTVPDFGALFLWGIPLLGLANAISVLIAWALPALADRFVKLIGGIFFALALLFVFTMDYWVGLCPGILTWGPAGLWAFTGFLMFMDFYPKPWAYNWWGDQRTFQVGADGLGGLLLGFVVSVLATGILILLF